MFFFTKKFLVSLSASFMVLFAFGFVTFHTTHPVFAEVTFIQDVQLNYEIPGVEGKKINVTSIQRLQETFIKPFFNTLFGIGGIIAVLGIALGGLQYMGAGASIGNVKEGQAKIFNAIMGVVLLLSSFLLLRTINPQILGGVGGIGKCGDTDAPAKEYSSLCPLPKFEQSSVSGQIQKNQQDKAIADATAVDKKLQDIKKLPANEQKAALEALKGELENAKTAAISEADNHKKNYAYIDKAYHDIIWVGGPNDTLTAVDKTTADIFRLEDPAFVVGSKVSRAYTQDLMSRIARREEANRNEAKAAENNLTKVQAALGKLK